MASSVLDGRLPAGADETGRPADQAIARVLAAERDARLAVAECAQQAERESQLARDAARRIAARSAERVTRVQEAAERQLASALARVAVEREALAAHETDPAAIAERLQTAVTRLARELSRGATGATSPIGTPGSGE
jgi:hypothetical protein